MQHKNVTAYIYFLILLCIIPWFFIGEKIIENHIQTEKEILIVKEKNTTFSKEKLIDKLLEVNVKFPEVAMAQAILETGNFKSLVFKENNNLFGMKVARIRPTTATGTNLNHATYKSWEDSVYDYALYRLGV